MKLDEKLTYFDDQVKSQTQEEIDQEIEQYRQTLEEDLANYKKQTDENLAKRLETEKEAIRRESNKILSQMQISQQKDLFLNEEKRKSTLFQAFEKEIENYKNTDQYVDQLLAMIKKFQSFAKNETYDLYIDRSDAHLKDQLAQRVNHPVSLSDRDFIGGIRGVLRERQILFDYSFSSLLDQMQEDFVIKGAL